MKRFVIQVLLLHSAQNSVSMSITQEVILCLFFFKNFIWIIFLR